MSIKDHLKVLLSHLVIGSLGEAPECVGLLELLDVAAVEAAVLLAAVAVVVVQRLKIKNLKRRRFLFGLSHFCNLPLCVHVEQFESCGIKA